MATPQSDIANSLALGGPLGNNISVLADNIAYYLEQGESTSALALALSIRAEGLKSIAVKPNLVAIRPTTSTTD